MLLSELARQPNFAENLLKFMQVINIITSDIIYNSDVNAVVAVVNKIPSAAITSRQRRIFVNGALIPVEYIIHNNVLAIYYTIGVPGLSAAVNIAVRINPPDSVTFYDYGYMELTKNNQKQIIAIQLVSLINPPEFLRLKPN